MGENGAGKSTLIKILAGLYTPDSGEYMIDGQPANLKSPLDGINAGISVIYQELYGVRGETKMRMINKNNFLK